MHLVTGVRRPRAPRLAARNVAVAGIVDFLDLSMESQVDRLHEAIVATKSDITSWKDKVTAEAEGRAGNPSFPQCKSGDSGAAFISNCLTKTEQAGNDFIIKSWDPFLERWRDYAGGEEGVSGWFVSKAKKYKWTEADNIAFNNDLENLRSQFRTRTGAPLDTPLPTKKPEDKGPAGTIDRLSNSLDNVVLIAGIGVAAYFLVPAFFGAASRVKSARREYQEA